MRIHMGVRAKGGDDMEKVLREALKAAHKGKAERVRLRKLLRDGPRILTPAEGHEVREAGLLRADGQGVHGRTA